MQVKARVLKFAYQCIMCDNITVNCLARYCIRSNLHVLGSNVSLILRDLNGSVHDMVHRPSLLLHHKTNLIHSQFPDPSARTAAFIIDILDNDLSCPLNDMEQCDVLFYLCCE